VRRRSTNGTVEVFLRDVHSVVEGRNAVGTLSDRADLIGADQDVQHPN
jgi:hypothetical protein